MIDTHAHVYDSYKKSISYIPNSMVSIKDYISKLDEFNISKGVLIQPSFLGFDNSYLLNALQMYPHRLRGVVVIKEDISLKELKRLDSLGVKGLRFNLFHSLDFNIKAYKGLLEHVYKLDWHIEVYANCELLNLVLKDIENRDLKIVIDHFGMPSSIKDRYFNILMQSYHNLYIKLSAPYRFEYDSINKVIEVIIKHRGQDKILWGSDFPFTRFEHMFDYESSLSFIKGYPLDDIEETVTKNAEEVFRF